MLYIKIWRKHILIYLMDMGTHFEMIDKKKHVLIEYGEYSLSLANIDYDSLQEIIQSYLNTFTTQFELATMLGYLNPKHTDKIMKYEQYGIYPNAVKKEVLEKINETLYKSLIDFLDNGYLNKNQIRLIAMLIISELEYNIQADTFNWQYESTYIPSVLIYKDLKNHLESILLRNSSYFSTEIQKKLMYKIVLSSISIDKNGLARTLFHIEDTIAFLMIDLQKYLTGTKTVLRCQNCKRLFYPKSSKNKLYCRLKHKDTNLYCNDIAHRNPSDKFAELAKRARGIQQGFVNNVKSHDNNAKFNYDYELLRITHELWQDECTSKMEYYRSQNDIDGFDKWIESTKFKVKKLEELHIRTRKK